MGYVQGRQHVARRDDIDSNARMGPFDRQTARQMSDGCFGGVVRGLWLRYIDDSTRHGPYHDHAPFLFSLHQMLRNCTGPEVGAVEIHAHQFVEAVGRVCDGVEVLGEAGGGDKMVHLAVRADDLVEGVSDRFGIRDVTEMRSDFRFPTKAMVSGRVLAVRAFGD